ncbi:MAG: hypothetical protein EZS28_035328, partial [Streblomastix strix]
ICQGSFSNAFLIVLTTESTTLFLLTKGDELQKYWGRSVGAATPKLPLQCTRSIPPIANVGRH